MQPILALVVVLLLVSPAFAHSAGTVELTWGDWPVHPLVLGGLVAAAAAYLWALRRFPARGRQPLYFWAGLLALVVALQSPLDVGAGYLFTLHMLQHMLLMIAAAPLLALGTPLALLGWLSRRPVIGPVMEWVWSPPLALALYVGNFAIWHVPAAYDLALRSEAVHVLQHLLFLGTGLAFWGVIASPYPAVVQASYGRRIAMLLAAAIGNWAVSLILALAKRPLYHPYEEAPRLWGFTPLADQTFGAALMWVMSNMMYVGAIVLIVFVLLRREERTRVGEA